MKINSALVVQLRNAKSWSQEELATAAGLNLRTIQRIENEASASLQSKKALASVFEIDIKAFESMEASTMIKHEYKTLNIPIKRGFMSGITKTPLPDIEKILNEEGAQGWRLVQILTPDILSSWGKATENMVALFERPTLHEPGRTR
jgi:transcriptional regulator with XRE-family HTH domain